MIKKESLRRKVGGNKKESRTQTNEGKNRKQGKCKERQRRKIESRRQGNYKKGKERLKRIGSEKTKMEKCMFHLENRQQQTKERRKRRK